jgi:hypothetical protein
LLYIWFKVGCAIVFPAIWIIRVSIPVKPIHSVRNAFRWAILFSLDWMTIHSSDYTDI